MSILLLDIVRHMRHTLVMNTISQDQIQEILLMAETGLPEGAIADLLDLPSQVVEGLVAIYK